MKKLMVVVLAILLAASTAYAATDNIGQGMADKAVRGVVNLVTGIVEVPMQIKKGYVGGFEPIKNEAGSKTVGTVLGIFRGFSHAAGRVGWGGLELFGFWAVNPADNDGVGIPLDAEYAWEEGTPYNIFEPSFSEGVKPIGNKLIRGLANGFIGIAELPGQILKGKSEGELVKGIGKGFWYWWSRQVYGMGDIYSCLVPNPPDNPGVAFEDEWPWTALSDQTSSKTM